ncbi:MAG: tyrosine/phenylalanine carboxypeptidase domain-containing protein [Patescibacteria group bacterium]
MGILSRAGGILGMNARNLLYLYRFNSQAHKKLADDKLFTKRYLSARGIGVAKLYATIRSFHDLRTFNYRTLPKSFVIKPNRGYGGEGIIPIRQSRGDTFTDLAGTRYTWDDLADHCTAILDGKFAVSGLRDQVLIEELLEPHQSLRPFIEFGLPDVRIIVFRYVPVMAMLRLPTPESAGKANLHLGAIGLGIDMGSGKTTAGVQNGHAIRRLPNGTPVSSIAMPQWDDLLLTAARTQSITQIGYLAVDLALCPGGIKVLELNARAGLGIQICNRALLRRRLEKIGDVKVLSPTEGVKLSKTLFTAAAQPARHAPAAASKPVIGLFEYTTILNTGTGSLLTKIDPHAVENTVDTAVTLPPDEKLITVKVRDQKVKVPFRRADLSESPYKVILAGRYLSGFLVDASQTVPVYRAAAAADTPEEKIIINIDRKLASLAERVSLLTYLKPDNLEAEQKKFTKDPGRSPQFSYRELDLDLPGIRSELRKVPRAVSHPLMPLYLRKIEELEQKLSLLEHVGHRDIFSDSAVLYGTVTDSQYRQALQVLQQEPPAEDTSKHLRTEEVVRRVEQYLAERHLTRWKVKVLAESTAGMQVNKKGTVLVSSKSRITANRLLAMLAHEIETHVYRLENGLLQRYRLLEQGTAGYLTCEEGLAIFNQARLNLPLGAKYTRPALNVIAIYLGARLSFAELFRELTGTYQLDPEKAWWVCVRVKRGVADTGEPGAFTKDRAYFVGYNQVRQLAQDKGLPALRQLYIGKISMADLKYLGDIRQWQIKYVPTYLQ